MLLLARPRGCPTSSGHHMHPSVLQVYLCDIYDYHHLIPAIAPAPHELGGWPRRHKSIGIACSRSSWLATPPNDKQTQHIEHYVYTPHCMPTSHYRVLTTPPCPPELGRRPRQERVPILAHAPRLLSFSAAGKMHSDLKKSSKDETLEASLFAMQNTD